MADNVPITAGTGTTIAADDIGGGVFAQRVKPVWGPDGTGTDTDATHPLPVQIGDASTQANVLAGDTGQSSQLIAGSRKEVTFTTTTVQAVASTDVSNYRWFSVHITSQGGSSNVTLQGSNDNTNWVSVPGFTSTSTSGPAVNSSSATGILHGPVFFRYFRLNVTGIASGTTAGVVEFFAQPAAVQGLGVDTELPSAAALADGASNPTTPMAGAAGLNYNGTTWDRERSATSATATSGTGLTGAGVLGWDATNSLYRRLLCDASGYLLTRPQAVATATLTNVAAAVTTGNLVASNTSRRGLTIHNDTTGTNSLYLKLGATASTTSFTVKIGPGGYWELPMFGTAVYTGAVDGIWDSASGSARITEL